MKSTDNLYTFINFLAFDTAPGFSKISFLLARNLYHVIFYCSSITLEFKFKRWCTECYISFTKCNVQITLEVSHTMFNFGKGGGSIFHIKNHLMRMNKSECMFYEIILLYLIRCCVNFVLAQAVRSGAWVLRLNCRPVDIGVALAVQTCVR